MDINDLYVMYSYVSSWLHIILKYNKNHVGYITASVYEKSPVLFENKHLL